MVNDEDLEIGDRVERYCEICETRHTLAVHAVLNEKNVITITFICEDKGLQFNAWVLKGDKS